MLRSGWFITDEHSIYRIFGGSIYEAKLSAVPLSVKKLAPGYYDDTLVKVPVQEAVKNPGDGARGLT